MTTKIKKIQTGKIFGKVAKEMGFNGNGVTRYIEFPNYWLLINHQKSSYSNYFYINVGLIYKEILLCPITEDEVKNSFKANTNIFLHVMFRIEQCPEIPENLTVLIGRAIEDEQESDLANTVKEALSKLLFFMNKNYDRQTIRKLYNDKKLSAMILKEV